MILASHLDMPYGTVAAYERLVGIPLTRHLVCCKG
jgi:hypothetical protein